MVQRAQPVEENMPLLELSAEVELSDILTVHGSLKIADTGTLFFTPALDARLMGVEALELPLQAVRGLERSHQGRRVLVHADVPLTLRGPGGYQTWLAIQVLRDCAQSDAAPILTAARRDNLYGELNGLLGIGRRGLGFAAAESPLFGALSTVWEDFGSLEHLQARDEDLHLQIAGRRYHFRCSEAEDLLKAIRHRWLARATSGPGSWAALRRLDGGLQCGSLSLGPQGLLFVPRQAPARLLTPRGKRIYVREADDHILLSDDGEKWATFWVDQVPQTAAALRAELQSPAWLREAKGVGDLRRLQGSCRVVAQLGSCSFSQQVELSGGIGQLHFLVRNDAEVAPWTIGTVEIFGAGGHTLIDGWVTAWDRRDDGMVSVHFCSSAPLKDMDQRAHYRLPLEERLPRFSVVEGRGLKKIDGAMLLDLSRGGAGVWLNRELPEGSQVELLMQVEKMEGNRRRVESFLLKGVVVHRSPATINGGEGWRLGIRFAKLEVAAFDARQRVWLQTRCAPAGQKQLQTPNNH